MSATYSGNPASSPRDAVRLLIGDTDVAEALLQDEEIDWLLSRQPNVELAAADACEAIAAKFARQADTTNGDLSVRASQRAEAYRQRAADLRRRAGRRARWFVGGATRDPGAAADPSLAHPAFGIGMDDLSR